MTESLVTRARAIAAEALRDETRYDGSPFLGHADGVAFIVQDEIGLPAECVAAVYLHEATRTHKDIDISGFPQDIRAMVDGLNKISTIKPKDTRLEAENYKKLIVQYSTDPRVTVIKIADRLEVMRHLNIFPKSSREQKLLETQMLYMPIAHQLGLYNINSELGNIYFRYEEPEQYRQIMQKLKATEKYREELSREFIEPLKKGLSDEGIKYKLKVRTKTAWSIYRKMQVQKVPFEKVYDVFAIRFINYVDIFPKIKEPLRDTVCEATEPVEVPTDPSSDMMVVPTDDDLLLMQEIERLMQEQALFKATDLSIANLAALCGKSHRVVSMAINHCQGVNFKTYINEYRVAEAARLIETGWLKHHTLDALALETGFTGRVNLYRAFKRKMGVSPTDWEAKARV